MWAIVLINSGLVTAAILIHYEVLNGLAMLLPRLPINYRLRVLVGVFGCLFAHVLEVWLFAAGYFGLLKDGRLGTLQGNFHHTLMDCSYFSFTTYTSLGLGDIEPIGEIRFLVGLEPLTGLLLITWSASFMYLEMQRYWGRRERR